MNLKVVLASALLTVVPVAEAVTQNPVLVNSPTKVQEEDLKCLALNIYHEARNESLAGQVAVAQVVMNRVSHNSYPDNVCDVVQDGYKPGRRDCQFSWYCDGKSDEAKNIHSWRESVTIANAVLDDIYPDITEGALWYHADYVYPKWRKGVKYVTQIDRHIFYSELGE